MCQLNEIQTVVVLTCGCAPGGNLSNVLTRLLQGDMNLRCTHRLLQLCHNEVMPVVPFLAIHVPCHCWLKWHEWVLTSLFPSALWWLPAPRWWVWAWCLWCSSYTARVTLTWWNSFPTWELLERWSWSSLPPASASSSTITGRGAPRLWRRLDKATNLKLYLYLGNTSS